MISGIMHYEAHFHSTVTVTLENLYESLIFASNTRACVFAGCSNRQSTLRIAPFNYHHNRASRNRNHNIRYARRISIMLIIFVVHKFLLASSQMTYLWRLIYAIN